MLYILYSHIYHPTVKVTATSLRSIIQTTHAEIYMGYNINKIPDVYFEVCSLV